jgi:hypothetical protein
MLSRQLWCWFAALLLLAGVSAASAREFATSGAWSFSSLPGHETNKNSIYSRDASAVATWTPQLRSDGPTRLSLHVVTHQGNDRAALVDVFAEGKTNTVRVNMESGSRAGFRWATSN